MRPSNIEDMTTTEKMYLDLAAAAERTGIRYRTLRNYHHRAAHNRRLAEEKKDPNYIRPGDFPEQDDKFGRSPVWYPATIDAWMENRPGQGKGGGRPVGYSPKKKEE